MRNARVLIADDSPTVRAAVRKALADSGCEVIEAADGVEALACLDEAPADVVLLDITMPELDGLEVLDRMRASPRLATIPVIVLTGHTGREEVVAALQRGAHDYLTKPFEPTELAARVGAAGRAADLLQRLARRNTELDLFASKAAHDLKSPLTVMKGAADLLRAHWDRLPADVRSEQLEVMARAAARAATMIDDLLALARFDADRSDGPAVTDVRRCIDDVVADAPLGPDDAVELGGEFATAAIPLADLSAALRNLVDNASHYGRGADGRLRVEITGRVTAGRQVIDIRDHGPGIPDQERQKVFDPFYRGPGSLNVNPASTGVGLAIVARAVERWGGLVVADAASPGALFRVAVPLSVDGNGG